MRIGQSRRPWNCQTASSSGGAPVMHADRRTSIGTETFVRRQRFGAPPAGNDDPKQICEISHVRSISVVLVDTCRLLDSDLFDTVDADAG